MDQNVYRQARGISERAEDAPRPVKRFLPVVIFFAIAFTADMLTNQRYSSVWGSAAIIASAIHLFPAIRPALAAVGGFAGVWLGFNLVRAVAEDTGLALAGVGTVADVESAIFGGQLPSEWLQSRFFDPDHIRFQDMALSLVHGSFFVVPFVVAAVVWWKRRELFRPYLIATAVTFALGLIGFILLPTAPPWMSDPDEVTRVTHHVVERTSGVSLGGDDGEGFWFEPNDMAAMPSVHVAVAVLVFLLAMQVGRTFAVLGGIYAVLMSVAVVYLGEHFLLDAVLGWGIAVVGWRLAWPSSSSPINRSQNASASRIVPTGVSEDSVP